MKRHKKEKNSGVRQKDFKTNSLLHQVAKVDIRLACRLAKQYGGKKIYICNLGTIERNVRNRLIMKRASVCVSHNRIANDLGLTGNWVGRLVKKNIQAYFAENPLPPVPDQGSIDIIKILGKTERREITQPRINNTCITMYDNYSSNSAEVTLLVTQALSFFYSTYLQ